MKEDRNGDSKLVLNAKRMSFARIKEIELRPL